MIDTKPQRLATLRQQAERLPVWEQDAALLAFEVADAFVEETDRIRGERYRPERETEELTAARQTAVAGFGEVLAEIDRVVDDERTRVVDAFDGDRATRVRENRRLVDVIDVGALLAADDAREVRNTVEAAGAYGLDAEARQVALRVTRPKAADEQRRGRLNGEWFSLLCWLSGATVTPGDRHEVSMRVDARRAALKAFVRDVAQVVGVAAELTRTVAQQESAPPPDAKPSAYAVGRWWDLNPNFRR